MDQNWTQESIQEALLDELYEALGLEDVRITPTSRLILDLYAEGMDFVDIYNRLRHLFRIQIPFNEQLYGFEGCLVEDSDPTSFRKAIVEKLPFLAGDELESIKGNPLNLSELVTVELLCRFVSHKLGVQWIVTPKADLVHA